MMTRAFHGLCVLLIAGCVVTPAQSKEGWTDDHAAALKRASETKQPLVLYFTGSDW